MDSEQRAFDRKGDVWTSGLNAGDMANHKQTQHARQTSEPRRPPVRTVALTPLFRQCLKEHIITRATLAVLRFLMQKGKHFSEVQLHRTRGRFLFLSAGLAW